MFPFPGIAKLGRDESRAPSSHLIHNIERAFILNEVETSRTDKRNSGQSPADIYLATESSQA